MGHAAARPLCRRVCPQKAQVAYAWALVRRSHVLHAADDRFDGPFAIGQTAAVRLLSPPRNMPYAADTPPYRRSPRRRRQTAPWAELRRITPRMRVDAFDVCMKGTRVRTCVRDARHSQGTQTTRGN